MTNLSLQAARLQRGFDDTFGGRLSTARDAAGVELYALANHLGVTQETLTAWETDRSEPRANRLVNLAGILGVSPMWLMTGAGDGPAGGETDTLPLDAMRSQLERLMGLQQENARLIETLAQQIDRCERQLTGPGRGVAG